MSLQIQTTRVEPDIVVVHLIGRMTSRVDNPTVQPVVTDLLNHNERKLGLRSERRPGDRQHRRRHHHQMLSGGVKGRWGSSLRRCNPKVHRLFTITRLDTVLPIYPTVAGACEGFTITPNMSE